MFSQLGVMGLMCHYWRSCQLRVGKLYCGILHCKLRDSCLEQNHFERFNFCLQEVDKCLADGADEYLQLMSLCALVMQQLTQNT